MAAESGAPSASSSTGAAQTPQIRRLWDWSIPQIRDLIFLGSCKFCFARTRTPPTAVGRTKHMTSICAKLSNRPQRSESDAQCNAMQHNHTDCCSARTLRPPTVVERTTHMTSVCAKLAHRPQRSESNAQCNAMQYDHTDCLLLCHAVPITQIYVLASLFLEPFGHHVTTELHHVTVVVHPTRSCDARHAALQGHGEPPHNFCFNLKVVSNVP